MRQREERAGAGGDRKREKDSFGGFLPFISLFLLRHKPVPGSQNWSVSVFLPVCLSFPLFLFFSLFSPLLLPVSPLSTSPPPTSLRPSPPSQSPARSPRPRTPDPGPLLAGFSTTTMHLAPAGSGKREAALQASRPSCAINFSGVARER